MIETDNLVFTVEEVRDNRISRVRLRILPPPAQEEEEEERGGWRRHRSTEDEEEKEDQMTSK